MDICDEQEPGYARRHTITLIMLAEQRALLISPNLFCNLTGKPYRLMPLLMMPLLTFGQKARSVRGLTKKRTNKPYNYDWTNTSIPFRLNQYQSHLARVTVAGSNIDNYQVSSTNQVAMSNFSWELCEPATQNCTGLVSEIMASPAQSRGIILSLDNFSPPNHGNTTRYLSFSAGECVICEDGPFPEINNSIAMCTFVIGDLYGSQGYLCKGLSQNIVDSASNPYRWGFLGNHGWKGLYLLQ